MEFNPEDHNIRYHLAASYERKGELEQAQKEAENNQQPSPEMLKVQLEQQKLQIEAQDKQSIAQERQANIQKDLLAEQNKSREISLKEMELRAKLGLEDRKVTQDGLKTTADINQGNADLGIKQQEADRKEEELRLQTAFRMEQLNRDENINPNLAGSVGSLT